MFFNVSDMLYRSSTQHFAQSLRETYERLPLRKKREARFRTSRMIATLPKTSEQSSLSPYSQMAIARTGMPVAPSI